MNTELILSIARTYEAFLSELRQDPIGCVGQLNTLIDSGNYADATILVRTLELALKQYTPLFMAKHRLQDLMDAEAEAASQMVAEDKQNGDNETQVATLEDNLLEAMSLADYTRAREICGTLAIVDPNSKVLENQLGLLDQLDPVADDEPQAVNSPLATVANSETVTPASDNTSDAETEPPKPDSVVSVAPTEPASEEVVPEVTSTELIVVPPLVKGHEVPLNADGQVDTRLAV